MKSQETCEFDCYPYRKKGGNFMKEEVKKEREIYAIGRPSLDTLTPNERKVFFSTLLQCVIEHFKEKSETISDDK